MAQHRPITLKDIAEKVGVGTATVSVVLNGARSGTKVSEDTRAAILSAAAELNYRPNALARSLRKRSTGIVGFYSGYQYVDARNEYIAEVVAGMEIGCQANDLDLLLYTPHASHTADNIVANLADGRLDGLVVTARPEHAISQLLASSHLPVVALADPLPGMPCVLADAKEGGRLQAQHLHAKGHRRVMYVPSDYPFLSVLDRYDGFCSEARRLGIEVELSEPMWAHRESANWVAERSGQLAQTDISKVQGSDRCSAVVCWDDGPAYRIASQLADLGIDVPGDVSVVGYNGCTCSVEPRWKLTTICAHWPDIGQKAIEVLSAMIRGHDYEQQTIMPVELLEGATA